jgi:hypothetical protein
MGTVQLVEKFVDHRDGKHVLDGDGIEGAVVDAKHHVSSAFLTSRTGKENAEVLRRISPWDNMEERWPARGLADDRAREILIILIKGNK